MARFLAWLACDVFKIRQRVVEENLRHAFPEWSEKKRHEVTRRMWEHLVLMVCEIAHVPRKIHETNWHQYLTLKNIEPQIRCLLDHRPAILLSGHFGNFEVAGYLASLFGYQTTTIARTLDNPFLERFVQRFRGAHGQQILPKHGIAQQIAELLDSGGKLALLADQFGGHKGCWINFFGRPASYHKAIAVFSLTSKAPLIVTYAKRLDRPLHFEIGVLGVFDPTDDQSEIAGARELTQFYNDHLEDIIRTAPEQYWWLHRRWKDPRPASKKKISTRKDAA